MALSRFPRTEYEQRWQRVNAAMRELGYDCLIVWQRGAGSYDRAFNVHWLANFVAVGSGQDWADEEASLGWSFAALLFIKGREPELHTGQPEATTDLTGVECGRVVFHIGNVLQSLADHLARSGVEGKVAVVGDDTLPGLYDRALRRLTPQIDWVTEEYLLVDAQKVKSPLEQDVYREAGRIVSDALNQAMLALIAGESTAEAASRAVATVVRHGGGVHRADMNFGPRSERFIPGDPLYGYSLSKPSAGDVVRAWIYGPISNGFWLDPGRTAICGGKPTHAQRDLIQGTADIVNAVIAELKAGVTPRQLGVAGDTVARRVGYFDSPQILPLYGHQIGPYLGPYTIPGGATGDGMVISAAMEGGHDEPLLPGMVVGVEAFLTHPGIGTAGIEQNLIVTASGSELLTVTPLVY